MAAPQDVYAGIAPVTDFAALAAGEGYTALPDDWLVGTADIVSSTAQIAQGQYKTVNMIGAAVIAALANALQGAPFPFVFGGDGAAFAVPPSAGAAARRTLSELRRWAEEEFSVALRAALVPVATLRAEGVDLRVARYAPDPGQGAEAADYAMFSGGGMALAEARMKAGADAVPPAPPGSRPDLTGLSCRWANLRAQNGLILSLVVLPVPGAPAEGFRDIAAQVVEIASHLSRSGHPVPPQGPPLRWPPAGLRLEARATHGQGSLPRRLTGVLLFHLMAFVLLRFGLRLGDFDAGHYARQVSVNADFRKMDDGLKMTLDCDAATRDRIETVLRRGAEAGLIRYGLFDQAEALVTCFVPSASRDDHMHFVDGAAGGYTEAARRLKSS
ncbi:DUF3095 domain-containing protein [Pseudodonghicola flavimaris]|uniref:DUF3095 domain-containing protein n=1 Tax=Pseudodonghicola flavimaris TaxID=3050036 RepID=A0ABT7F6S6_9RHOB|nr:DUF3095 domain-containing protein [Pseudodonghicola flavimaris]MDK3020304.1 DUF3095 domain-containing protein [Pseudodonghicola flavimaris]